eukprot:gene17595-23925_t
MRQLEQRMEMKPTISPIIPPNIPPNNLRRKFKGLRWGGQCDSRSGAWRCIQGCKRYIRSISNALLAQTFPPSPPTNHNPAPTQEEIEGIMKMRQSMRQQERRMEMQPTISHIIPPNIPPNISPNISPNIPPNNLRRRADSTDRSGGSQPSQQYTSQEGQYSSQEGQHSQGAATGAGAGAGATRDDEEEDEDEFEDTDFVAGDTPEGELTLLQSMRVRLRRVTPADIDRGWTSSDVMARDMQAYVQLMAQGMPDFPDFHHTVVAAYVRLMAQGMPDFPDFHHLVVAVTDDVRVMQSVPAPALTLVDPIFITSDGETGEKCVAEGGGGIVLDWEAVKFGWYLPGSGDGDGKFEDAEYSSAGDDESSYQETDDDFVFD